MDGTSWYPDPPDLKSETFDSFKDTSDFSGHQIGAITGIPYVCYGTDKIKYFYDNSLDKAGHEHYMDIYFPVQFIHQCKNHGYTYPVLIYLPGGGFANSNRSNTTSDCKKFAEKGFIVVNIDYRTARHVQCDDANNNYVLVRALQDERLAMRTVKAISLNAYNLINANSRYIYLPFINIDKIFLGGISAGAVTSLTAAYYDACDLDSAMNRNEELRGTHLGKTSTSTYTITCNGKNKSVPFQLDEDTCKTGADTVIYYFDPSMISSAPMDNIVGVISLKGGVPEHGNDYEITQRPGIGRSVGTGRPFDPNDGSTYPKFIANASDRSDYIPMIGFQGVNDNLVPFSNNFEPIYILDDPANNCTGQYDDIQYAYCWDDQYDNCGSAGHRHVPKNGFLFGSKKVFDALNHRGVKTQLYAKPGTDHGFEGDQWSFITAQSALFANAVLCKTLTTDFDSLMNYKVWSGSIGFDNCTTGAAAIHFHVVNNNKTAVITRVDIGPPVIYKNGGSQNIVTSPTTVSILDYTGKGDANYILPGDSGTFILNGITLLNNQSIGTGNTYKIQVAIQNVDGFDDSSFSNIYTYKIDSVVRSITGTGCFARMDTDAAPSIFTIYPNPSSGSFNVFSLNKKVEISIYDVTGKEFDSFRVTDNFSFGKNYPPGIYLIKAQFANSGIVLRKVVKTSQ